MTSLTDVVGYNCIKQQVAYDCALVIYVIIIFSFDVGREFFQSVHVFTIFHYI